MKSTEPEFWDSRYQAGRMPWDFQGVPAALTAWLAVAPPGQVLIPGCGSGYEVRAFAGRGWEVVALDFSDAAVARARKLLGPLGRNVLLADFFRHDFGGRRFDAVYERTFLCSLPPDLRPAYARRMAELLPGGGKLIGFFLYGVEEEPPPYPMADAESQALLGGSFDRIADAAVADSVPLYAGRERWQVWERRSSQTAGGDAR